MANGPLPATFRAALAPATKPWQAAFRNRGAVDLSGQEQTADRLGFQARLQLIRRTVIVFDRVTVAHDLGSLQTRDHAQDRILHVARQNWSRYH